MKNAGIFWAMMAVGFFGFCCDGESISGTATPPVSQSSPGFRPQAPAGLDDLAERFDLQFVGADLPAWAKVDGRGAGSADAAIDQLRTALGKAPEGSKAFDVKEFHVEGSTRVFEIIDPDRPRIPIHFGSDLKEISDDDTVITQIIRLKNIDAVRVRGDMKPMPSGDVAPRRGTQLVVVTDQSRGIRRIVEVINRLEEAGTQPATIIQYRQLQNADAAEAVRLIDVMVAPAATTPARPVAAATTTRQGVPATTSAFAAPIHSRLYADSDARTNTVILNGPPELVRNALQMLIKIDTPSTTHPETKP